MILLAIHLRMLVLHNLCVYMHLFVMAAYTCIGIKGIMVMPSYLYKYTHICMKHIHI